MTRRHHFRTAFALLLVLPLSACGNRGPLFLQPASPPPPPTMPAPATTTAPAEGVPAETSSTQQPPAVDTDGTPGTPR